MVILLCGILFEMYCSSSVLSSVCFSITEGSEIGLYDVPMFKCGMVLLFCAML